MLRQKVNQKIENVFRRVRKICFWHTILWRWTHKHAILNRFLNCKHLCPPNTHRFSLRINLFRSFYGIGRRERLQWIRKKMHSPVSIKNMCSLFTNEAWLLTVSSSHTWSLVTNSWQYCAAGTSRSLQIATHLIKKMHQQWIA